MIKPFFFMEGLCSCVEFLVEQALILHSFMDINYDGKKFIFSIFDNSGVPPLFQFFLSGSCALALGHKNYCRFSELA